MEQITLGQIQSIILWLVSFSGGLFAIVKVVRSAIAKGFKPLEDKIDVVDKNATKNFLVTQLAEIKKGEMLDDISRQRFYEQYEHYIALKGNSYIKSEDERLRKEGKL